jgi:hypothetical protein
MVELAEIEFLAPKASRRHTIMERGAASVNAEIVRPVIVPVIVPHPIRRTPFFAYARCGCPPPVVAMNIEDLPRSNSHRSNTAE